MAVFFLLRNTRWTLHNLQLRSENYAQNDCFVAYNIHEKSKEIYCNNHKEEMKTLLRHTETW